MCSGSRSACMPRSWLQRPGHWPRCGCLALQWLAPWTPSAEQQWSAGCTCGQSAFAAWLLPVHTPGGGEMSSCWRHSQRYACGRSSVHISGARAGDAVHGVHASDTYERVPCHSYTVEVLRRRGKEEGLPWTLWYTEQSKGYRLTVFRQQVEACDGLVVLCTHSCRLRWLCNLSTSETAVRQPSCHGASCTCFCTAAT